MAVQQRPPLGLPRGSVRALLTLLIVAVVVSEAVRGREVPLLWTETLMIALAHYFTSRRFVQLSPEAVGLLEERGHLPRESSPLFLPRHTIRILVVVAFLGLAVYLSAAGRLLQPQSLTILGTVAAYFVGIVVGAAVAWWTKERETTPTTWWEDAKAVAVLFALGITSAAFLADRAELIPRFLRHGTLGLVLFYFGSR